MQPGHILSRYVILGKLARGGMAEVWLARQHGLAGFNKTLVLKTILPAVGEDGKFFQMFLDEARLAAQLNHPNVVQINDLDMAEGRPFIAMEYLDGRNLAQVQRALASRGEHLDPLMSARIMLDVCAALEYAHALKDESGVPLNIIHRDVTPENIFLTYQGQVKVLDFGIAKATASSNLTQPGTIRGKLAYMAPEQVLAEKLDNRVDIWAMGVNLYMLLTGQLPFTASGDVEFMAAILQATPLAPSALTAELPHALEAIVMRALQKNRKKRFADAGEMRAQLDAYVRGHPPVSSFQIAEVMERLFPAATDSERVRLNALRTVQTAGPAARNDNDSDTPTLVAPMAELSARVLDAMHVPEAAPVEEPTANARSPAASVHNRGTAPIKVPALLAPGEASSPENTLIAAAVSDTDATAADGVPLRRPKPRSHGRTLGVVGVVLGALAAGLVVFWPAPPAMPPEVVVTPPPPVVTPEPPPPTPDPPPPPVEPVPPVAPVAAVAPEEPEPPDEDEEAPAPAPVARPLNEVEVRANPNTGALFIGANMRAEVYVDGKHVGRAPATVAALRAGDHRVRVVSARGAVREMQVPVLKGILTERRVNFGRGRLNIKVAPWADVFIDGKRVGTTPMQPQRLAEGTHEVVLTNREMNVRKVMNVTIRADREEELKVRLQK